MSLKLWWQILALVDSEKLCGIVKKGSDIKTTG